MTLANLANDLRRIVEAGAAQSHAKISPSNSLPQSKLSKQPEIHEHTTGTGIALLANLKEVRNRLASISYLPDELLAEILYHTITAERKPMQFPSALLVCRRWYRIGMETSKLWTSISNVSDVFPNYVLRSTRAWEERSKSAPVDLTLDLRAKVKTKILQRNQERTQWLSIQGDYAQTLATLDTASALPILETLVIINRQSQPREHTIVPLRLFEGSVAPRLREVVFENSFLANPSDFQLLRNLTNLTLCRSTYDDDTRGLTPALSQLHTVLQSSPQLHILRLIHYITWVEPEGLPNIALLPLVTLPCLDSLDVETEMITLTLFLRLLLFPSTCKSELSPVSKHTENPEHFNFTTYIHETRQFLACLTKHMNQGGTAPVLRSAKITFRGRNVFQLTLSDSADPDRPDHYSTLSRTTQDALHLELPVPSKPSLARKVLVKLFKALPLGHLKILYASGLATALDQMDDPECSTFSTATWKALIRALPPDMTFEVGINFGLIRLVDAVLSVMRKSSIAHPSGCRLRRKVNTHKLGYAGRPFKGLILNASSSYTFSLTNPRSEREIEQKADLNKAFLECLHWRLKRYSKIETPGKPSSGKVDMVSLTGFEEGYKVYKQATEIAPRLSKEVGGFYMWNKLWDGGTDEKAVKGWKREWRKKQVSQLHLAFPYQRRGCGGSDTEDGIDEY